MAKIKAAEVSKLRKMTGAGMMDCKKALQESDGDFEVAIDILRKKGQKVASKRAERDVSEGAVLATTSSDNRIAAMIALNCETDFVAKNDDFVKFTQSILDLAISEVPENLEELKKLDLNGKTVADQIINQIGIIGEKLDLSYYQKLEAQKVVSYVHQGNKLASIAGFNSDEFDNQVAKDVVMQIAAMNPIAVDKDGISKEVIDKEVEIGKEQAIQEGKPAQLAEKIAVGKLNKFFKENTLLNQQFVKDNKKNIRQYLQETDKKLEVTEFKRFTLNV